MKAFLASLSTGAALLLLLFVAAPSAKVVKNQPAHDRHGSAERPDRTSEVTEVETGTPADLEISHLKQPAAETPTPNELQSPEAGESINWYCVASGGGVSTSANFKICGTIGQTVAGSSGSTSFSAFHGFWQIFESSGGGCCTGTSVADVNCSGTVDITDIQVMIDHLYLTLEELCCAEEGNINYPGSGLPGESDITDIVDLQFMIDNQFLTLAPLPPCP